MNNFLLLIANNWPIYCQVISVSVLCYFVLKNENYKLFGSIIQKVYPLEIFPIVIGGCLLLIAFVISFHAEVFTQNDKYNEDKSKDGSKRNGYSWFNLVDVYQFPIDQLLLDQFYKSKNKLYLFGGSKTINFHLLIVDKTASNKESKVMNLLFANAKRILKDKILRTNLESAINVDSLKDFADVLMVASAINSLEQGNYKVLSGFYQGRYLTSTGISPTIYRYCDTIPNSTDPTQRLGLFIKKLDSKTIATSNRPLSDFEEMFKDIVKFGLTQAPKKNPRVMLTLISDFDDDYSTSSGHFDSLRTHLQKMQSLNIEQLNVFVLPLNKFRASASNSANKILNDINQELEDELLPNIISCDNPDLLANSEVYLNSIITNPNRPLGDESEVSAFFSINKPHSLRRGTTTIYLHDENDEPYEGDVSICIRSRDAKIVNAKANLADMKANIFLNKPLTVNVKKGKVEITFPSWLRDSEDYYLDFYAIDIKKRITSPIVFREKLTDTSTEALIFLLSLLYSSVTAFFGLIGWVAISINKFFIRWQKSLIGVAFIFFPFIIFIASTCYLIEAVFMSSGENKYVLWFAGFLPISFVSILVIRNFKYIESRSGGVSRNL